MSTEPTGTEGPLLERLDRLTGLLELALAPQIEAGRKAVRADQVDAAILDNAAGDWKPAAKLQQAVSKKTGKKTRAIQDHIGNLVERGFLQRKNAGSKTVYRATGVA
jgi:hypothetical protein